MLFAVFFSRPLRFIVPGALLLVPLKAVEAQTTAAGSTPGSFRVTESGAAQYRIPILVPPGIAGMEPKLALVYNSQAGNGLLGVGWSLEGLSVITRCPRTIAQDGVKGGINYDANDRYCLDGQRLVAISGAYGAEGTEYRTERESFTKVVSYGVAGNGPAWFKAWTKSGQIMEYGNSADSRIEAQGKSSVRVWAVNKVSDTKGNRFSVSYAEDNANGDYYPTRIDYLSDASTAGPVIGSVQFAYQARNDVAPAYAGGSVIRSQSRLVDIKTYVGANPVRDYKLAYSQSSATASSLLIGLTECAQGACLPPVSTGYQGGPPDFGPRITSSYLDTHFAGYQLVAGDFDGDGRMDLLYITDGTMGAPYAKGQQRSVFLSNADGSFGARIATSYLDTHFAGYQLVTGDFNGDGKTDLMYISDGSLEGPPYAAGQQRSVFLSNGDGTFSPRIASSYLDTHFAGYQLVTADFDGDGRTDLLYVTDGSIGPPTYGKGQQRSVFLSNGDGTFGPRIATSYLDTHFAGYQLVSGDFDGDGKTDLLYVSDGSVGPPTYGKGQQRSVFLSNGDGTFGRRIATSYLDTHFAVYELVAGDFNGDGKTDLLYITDGSVGPATYGKGQQRSVFLSAGDGTFAPRVATSYLDTHFANYRLVTGDFNGDGKTDVLYITDGAAGVPYAPGQQRSVFLSSGDGTFGPRLTSSYLDTHFSGYQLVAGDFNGDGKTDILYITDGSLGGPPYASGQQRSVFQSIPIVAPDLASSITDSLGKVASIAHKPLTDSTVHTRDSAAAYPMVDFRTPLNVVSLASSGDGAGGQRQTGYLYTGAKAHLQGGGFLGFRKLEATNAQTGIRSATTFRQDFPFHGLPASVVKIGPSGALLDEVTSTWSDSLYPNATGKYHRSDVTRSVETGNDLNGVVLPTVTTNAQYDGFGNPTSMTVSTADGHSKTTTNTYANDAASWFLGRLLRSTVQSTAP